MLTMTTMNNGDESYPPEKSSQRADGLRAQRNDAFERLPKEIIEQSVLLPYVVRRN